MGVAFQCPFVFGAVEASLRSTPEDVRVTVTVDREQAKVLRRVLDEVDVLLAADEREPNDEYLTRRGPYEADGRSENDPSL